MAMAASTAMLGKDQPTEVYAPRSGRKGSGRRLEARVAQEWGVDMARVTPRVAGEEYGVSSIPTHPPVVSAPEDVGLSARAMQGPAPRQAQPPQAQRAPAGTALASRVGVGQPHPPVDPHPGRRPPQREQSISEFLDTVAPKIDVGGLTMDIMMPIYSELERKAVEAERKAEEAAGTIADLEKKKDKLMSRVAAETEARTKNDAKVWRLAQNLIKAQTAAEHAEASLKDANDQLVAKERVLTDQEQRLLQERNEHKRTQRSLDRSKRDLAAAKARIEAKEKEVRPLQLQNLEMVQKLEDAQESLAKLQNSFTALSSDHADLKEMFNDQAGALEREKAAREDAQECESQLRILLEDEADKKGSTRDQLHEAQAQIKQLQSDLEQSKRVEGLLRKEYNQTMDELELERAAHGGSKRHLEHTTGSLKTMQTVEEALRAEIASARAQIDALSDDKANLLNTMGVLEDKVGSIISLLNRGQRVERQASQLNGSLDDDASQSSLAQPTPVASPVASPRGSKRVRVFKHSANLVEAERAGLLRELGEVMSLLTTTVLQGAPSDEEIAKIELEKAAEAVRQKAEADMTEQRQRETASQLHEERRAQLRKEAETQLENIEATLRQESVSKKQLRATKSSV